MVSPLTSAGHGERSRPNSGARYASATTAVDTPDAPDPTAGPAPTTSSIGRTADPPTWSTSCRSATTTITSCTCPAGPRSSTATPPRSSDPTAPRSRSELRVVPSRGAHGRRDDQWERDRERRDHPPTPGTRTVEHLAVIDLRRL